MSYEILEIHNKHLNIHTLPPAAKYRFQNNVWNYNNICSIISTSWQFKRPNLGKKRNTHILTFFVFISFAFRWMLRIDQKTNDCRRMGMGMVARNGCATPFTRSHDVESNVRGCWNSARCPVDRYRCCSMQNHEGMDFSAVLLLIWPQDLHFFIIFFFNEQVIKLKSRQ